MSALGRKLRRLGDGQVAFYCPGCKQTHSIGVEQPSAGALPRPTWSFNGDGDMPTFKPSILVRTGHHVPGHDKKSCWCTYNAEHPDEDDPFTCTVCHSFVTDGRIRFLGDCTHALAGQTVDLPDWRAP